MAATSVDSPGCVILLVDESAAMDAPVAESSSAVAIGAVSRKTKAASVATAINSLLGKLAAGPPIDVAVVGYRTDEAGAAEVGVRWGGPLTGRQFVRSGDLAASPSLVEQRVRRTPEGQQQPFAFPIWYQPLSAHKSPQIAAYAYCKALLDQWAAAAGPNPGQPLVIVISAGPSGDGNPHQAAQQVMQAQTPGGSPILMQAHLSVSETVPSTLYPTNRAYLTVGPMRDLFERASQLPAALGQSLSEAKVAINSNARAMIYNAKMIDLSRLLSVVTTHTKDWPGSPQGAAATAGTAAAAPPSVEPSTTPAGGLELGDPLGNAPADAAVGVPSPVPVSDGAAVTGALPMGDSCSESGEPAPGSLTAATPALVIFVLNRSVESPYSGDPKNVCAQLQEQLGDLVQQVARVGGGSVDVGVVSYGTDAIGEVEVRTTLEGGLAGRTLVRDNELATGAIRVDEYVEEMSNGVGGLLAVPRKRIVLVEVEPTLPASPVAAFAEVARLVGAWNADFSASSFPPLIIHLTRDKFDPAELQTAIASVQTIVTGGGAPLVYHAVITETPQITMSYSADDSEIAPPELREIWQQTSPLLGRQRLAEQKPMITAQSRGFVVNGKLDLALDAIKHAVGD